MLECPYCGETFDTRKEYRRHECPEIDSERWAGILSKRPTGAASKWLSHLPFDFWFCGMLAYGLGMMSLTVNLNWSVGGNPWYADLAFPLAFIVSPGAFVVGCASSIWHLVVSGRSLRYIFALCINLAGAMFTSMIILSDIL